MLCPRCGSEATKFGMIPTVKAGKKPRYRCKACGHTFYEKTETIGGGDKHESDQ